MASIDMTQRKLNFPPRFLPYLEKHRIFELFHECVELLVQVKPRDHVQFLKNVLPCAAMKKDKQRIVFLSPFSFDRESFSELLADCLGIQSITLMHLEMLQKEREMEKIIKIEVISERAEEESCICPGEGDVELPFSPMYYQPQQELSYGFESAESTETIKEEEEEKPKESCVCVCPCVDKNKAEEEGGAEEKGEKEEREGGKDEEEREGGKDEEEREGGKDEEEREGGKDEEPGEGQWEGEDKVYPCEPYDKKKKKRKPKPESFSRMGITSESHSLISDINYGLLAECELSAKGWILQDFPMSGEEAERLNVLGVIPTHALRIIVDEEAEEKNQEYKSIVGGWMKAYKYVPVLEIRVKNREIEELVRDMCSLLSVMPHRHAPMLPRVVLIGSRGSGVTTQGQKLARKYGLIHVEFEIVMSQALQQDDELCKLYKMQLSTRPDPELEAFILERALLSPACRNRGWVLTGYPRNIDQMRMLDIIATPPNRVIFVEVPPRECFVRLYYRKIDPCLGDEYKLPKIEPSGLDSYETPGMDPEIAARLLPHPKNNKKQVIHDIEQYFLAKKDIMTYCGKTASYVNGNQEVDTVFELIEQILINPAPAQPPRDPLAINIGIEESYDRLKKFRLSSGLFFNNLFLNPPEHVVRL